MMFPSDQSVGFCRLRLFRQPGSRTIASRAVNGRLELSSEIAYPQPQLFLFLKLKSTCVGVSGRKNKGMESKLVLCTKGESVLFLFA